MVTLILMTKFLVCSSKMELRLAKVTTRLAKAVNVAFGLTGQLHILVLRENVRNTRTE